MELSTRYEPQEAEAAIYAQWLENHAFKATPDSRTPYCITIPPPNVTGALHMGHALNHTVMDTLGRWKRMLGFNVLILPGTDHAGIATQAVVEKKIRAEQRQTRYDLGREAFIGKVWEWKEEYGNKIVSQMQRLGCGYDWDRLRFTMDESYVEAILTVFEQLYADGYIYIGERMVNWSPGFQSVISDIEIDNREEDGSLWHLRYPYTDGSGYIVVATSRPETLLGDTAVAVSPKDERYKAVLGKTITLPLVGREIPVLADDFVDAAFGTGAVKITPFHDPNDYEMGNRHGLERIEVIGPDAKMTANAGAYAGLDRFEARKRIVADLEELGLLEKIEPYRHTVPYCDRSGAVIEPRPSSQWFCKMGGTELVDKAIGAARDGSIRFLPERYRELYLRWMENIRDWPISRQLWWGHRLPVWRKTDSNPEEASSWVFARTQAEAEAKLGSTEILQSDDVLDTWFSSALWPFATLGWPQESSDLDYYYPTSLLSTAQEILYLWVARMIMTGERFIGKKPFDDVYIHATVLDEHGRRMSKSKGNGIDPVELIDLYGADALRFALAREAGQRQDIRFKPVKAGKQEQVEQARNFANKIWNASRFVMMNLEAPPAPTSGGAAFEPKPEALVDRWILSRLAATVELVNEGFATYNLDDATRALYEFFWSDFCDWYVEAAKPRLAAPPAPASGGASETKDVLWFTLERALRLLHPILPHLTETLWQALPGAKEAAGCDFLMQAAYPTELAHYRDEAAEAEWEAVQEITAAIRNLQAVNNLKKGGEAFVETAHPDVLAANRSIIEFLTRFTLVLGAGPSDGYLQPTRFGDVRLPRPEATPEELAAEKGRIEGELLKIEKDLEGLNKRLSDPSFAERAPEAVVTKTRTQQAELLDKQAKLTERLAQLGG
ncbi:valine--tRNA ligase [Armatimonas rosea]|uniref:Valine--tRNA ligase n=1 Tax=Armatimonas rosea TaxID=685828 RepID=A0A7W9W8K1_ARMRO|nr:valine--tRNA ligase [Armatimonas rosea]MBB6052863.1 valyl-tRNA synthetase [Armatimonas rosea]